MAFFFDVDAWSVPLRFSCCQISASIESSSLMVWKYNLVGGRICLKVLNLIISLSQHVVSSYYVPIPMNRDMSNNL